MTITLEYNTRQKGVKSLLRGVLETGLFREVASAQPTKKSEPLYDPEFVKMVEEAKKGKKRVWNADLRKELLGL